MADIVDPDAHQDDLDRCRAAGRARTSQKTRNINRSWRPLAARLLTQGTFSMRLFGNLFGKAEKTRNRAGHSRNHRPLRAAAGTPGAKSTTLPALAFAAPAHWVREDGAAVLDAIVGAARRPVVMTDDAAATCALFAVHTHCLDAAKI